MLNVFNCIVQEHDLRMVALSALICVLGCFTTITLLARAQVANRRTVLRWLMAASVIFGCSVWSLHFVAMLAFTPHLHIAYDIGMTAASILIATLGSLAAFLVWRMTDRSWSRIVVGGAALGLAIASMHYVGVSAMRFSGMLLFDGGQVALSIGVAIVLSIAALFRSTDLLPIERRLEVTILLAIAICGLHFTGMAAVTVTPGVPETLIGTVLGTTTLAVVVGAVSVIILLASLVAVLMEQHLSQRALRELRRMRLLSNLAHEVLFIQRDGTVLEVNKAGERMFRAEADQIVGQPLACLFAEGSVPALTRRERCPPLDREPEEMCVKTFDGTLISVELSCQSIDYLGAPATAVALRDLTDRKRDEARIRHLARHDALTNLPNRYSLQERLDLALDTASQDGTGLAIVYLDLDRFKQVNDLYGHATGDALLVQVSKRVLAEILPVDTLARIGGDEFVLVLAGGQPEKVAATTQRIIDTLRRPFEVEGHKVEVGASAGVALFPADGRNADALLRAADTAMYRVKDEGRGAVRFFEAAMDAQLQARRKAEKELKVAIECDEFVLHYQPIVNGTTGEVETFEALIRWNHPLRGMVSPAEFIPLAEETGLISPIGTWVIDTACRTAARWPHPWRVSVNVSPSQFRASDICAVVAAALKRNGLCPSRLVVEITEGVLIEDANAAVAILGRLRQMGIRLALDDFGTGFSSLSYLQLFKFDKFKIDKSFVSKLGQNEDALTITRTIVNLGHNLGLQVTAEGVETAEQLAMLQALEVDQVQGYLVARPAPVDAFSELDQARTRAMFHKKRVRIPA